MRRLRSEVRHGGWALGAGLVLLAGCGQAQQWVEQAQSMLPGAWKQGRVRITFNWQGGRPDFPEPVFLFGKAERTADPRVRGEVATTAGPVEYPGSEGLSFNVPNDEDLVIVVEFRRTASSLSDLLYYGISDRFRLEAARTGGTADVEVKVPIVSRPRLELGEPALRTGASVGNLPLTGAPDGGAAAPLDLLTDRGVQVQVSGHSDFPTADTATYDLGLPPGVPGQMRNASVPSVTLPVVAGHIQLASLFIRALDENQVASAPALVQVYVDDEQPRVERVFASGPAEAAPDGGTAGAVFGAGATVVLSMITNEPLRGAQPPAFTVTQAGTALPGFFADGEAASPTLFTWHHVVDPADPAGDYDVTVSTVDVAGNTSVEQVFRSVFRVSVVPPEVTLEVSRPGGRVPVAVSEALPHLDLTVRVDVAPGAGPPQVELRLVAPAADDGGPGAAVCAGGFGPLVAGAVAGNQHVFTTTFDACADLLEGYFSIVASAVDRAGNRAASAAPLNMDRTAPTALGPLLVREDAWPRAFDGQGRLHVGKFDTVHAGPGDGGPPPPPMVNVSFWASENLHAASMRVDETDVDGGTRVVQEMHLPEQSARDFAFDWSAPDDAQDGDVYVITAVLEDIAGVVGSTELGTVVYDGKAPVLPDGGFVHVRQPWGDRDHATPRFVLKLPQAPALEEDLELDVYIDRDDRPGPRLVSAQTVAGGTVADGGAELPLGTQDFPAVWVRLTDRAGNESGKVPVKDGEWTAAPRRVAGAPPAPVRAVVSRWLTERPEQPAVYGRAATPAELAALAQPDGTVVSAAVAPVDSWVALHPGPRASRTFALAFDEERGRAVLVQSDRERFTDTWEWTGARWERPDTTTDPSPVGGFSLAWHANGSAAGHTLLFGGSYPTSVATCRDGTYPSALEGGDTTCFSSDTWTFDGTDWSKVDAGPAPPSREGAVLGHDPVANLTLLFGGFREVKDALGRVQACPADPDPDGGVNCRLADTWSWNGSAWSSRTPNDVPLPPRSQAAMALNPGTGRLTMFGGNARRESGGLCPIYATQPDGGGCSLVDTWEWTGTNWQDISPLDMSEQGRASPDNPAGRMLHTMAGVPDGGTAWIFGGVHRPAEPGACPDGGASDGTRDCLMTDLWERADGGWRAVATSGDGGVPASEGAMVGDPARGGVLLFTTGTLWRRGPGDPAWQPLWRDGADAMPAVGDGKRPLAARPDVRDVVMWGGDRRAEEEPVWSWNGAWWSPWWPAGPAHPVGRQAHAMAYDAAARRLVVAGGLALRCGLQSSGSGITCGDTWFLEDGAWSAGPALLVARRQHAMAQSVLAGGGSAVVVFGGRDGTLQANELGDTCWLEGAAPTTWTCIDPPSSNDTRYDHAMAFDPGRGATVLFGGRHNANVLADVREWDGTAWADRTPTSGLRPAARANAALAYDPERGEVVLYGGEACTGTACTFLADAWSWNGLRWLRLLKDDGTRADGLGDGEKDGTPRAYANPTLAADPARRGLLLRGDRAVSWTLQSQPAERRPGLVVEADVAGAAVSSAAVTAVIVDTTVGGTGGARVARWSPARVDWVDTATHGASVAAPGPLPAVWVPTSADPVLTEGDALRLRLDPVTPGDGAAVAVDYVQVTVKYTR